MVAYPGRGRQAEPRVGDHGRAGDLKPFYSTPNIFFNMKTHLNNSLNIMNFIYLTLGNTWLHHLAALAAMIISKH